MISLTKSKEFVKHANQIPTIIGFENGRIIPHNELVINGIKAVNTRQEKYLASLNEFKSMQAP